MTPSGRHPVLIALIFLAVGPGLAGCDRHASVPAPAEASVAEAGPRFVDATAEAGFTHRHHKPVLDSKLDNIMAWVSSVGAAAAAGDFNRDGWVDLYVTDSRKGEPNRLYRNEGDGTFTDVAAAAGVADVNGEDGASMDCLWGDFDNDGWPDLYLVRWGRDSLFRNRGDGTFEDVTRDRFRGAAGAPGAGWHNSNAAVFLDYDRDGRLDLYVGNYFAEVDLWNLETTRIMHDDFERSRNGGRNRLYHQEADGRFVEVAAAAGVDDPGWTLAVGAGDVNNDGWPDLYVADDFGPDQLYLNRRDGTFANVSEAAIGFDTKKGMNAELGDFDNDGWIDVYVTNITTAEYLQEGNMLWHNNGPAADGVPTFTDISLESGTYDGGWGWGAKFLDYDNDGDLDLVSANGFISAGPGNYWYDLASWTVTGKDPTDSRNWPAIGDRSFSGGERTRFWRNDGLASFVEVSRQVGVDSTLDGRGIVVFDLDNDGDLDLYVANQDQPPNLYRNAGAPETHWLEIHLLGDPSTGTNRDAVGARVTAVTPGGLRLVRERDGGNGFAGQSDPRLHMGLGSEDRIELLEVRWPDGGLQYLEDVAVDRILEVRQDPSRYADEPRIRVAEPRNLELRTTSASDPGAGEAAGEDGERVEAELAVIEARLRRGEGDHALAARYRSLAAASGRHDRAIALFEELVAERREPWLRIELSSAYVDKIPTCGGVAAIVCKGSLAKKGLDQLDRVLEREPESWIGRFCRGINHLYWPRALRHSEDAVADLERCVELQRDREPRPQHLRVHVALGDAWVKAGNPDEARSAWRRGLETFPEAEELRERLAIEDAGELLAFVEAERNLEKPIDTDLSFLGAQRASRTGY